MNTEQTKMQKTISKKIFLEVGKTMEKVRKYKISSL